MSAPDPLSEAREALRRLLAYHPSRANDLGICQEVLARLDALPTPLALGSRDTVHIVDQPAYGPTRWGPGWFYPDAPVAREGSPLVRLARAEYEAACADLEIKRAAGTPVAREAMKRPAEVPDLMAALEESLGMKPPTARDDGGEDA